MNIQHTNAKNPKYLNKTIDQLIHDFMQEKQVDGFSYVLTKLPYIVKNVGYGFSDTKFKGEKLVGTRTLFPILKISQIYLTITVLQLLENNKIALHNTLGQYLVDFDSRFHSITIEDLLNSTTGLKDFRLANKYQYVKKYKENEIVQFILEANQDFVYSNVFVSNPTNHYLLAMIIDKIVDMRYEEYVKKYILEKFSFHDTFYLKDLTKIEEDEFKPSEKHQLYKGNIAYINAQELARSIINNGYYHFDDNLRGFSDILATACDLGKLDILLYSNLLFENNNYNQYLIQNLAYDGNYYAPKMGWHFNAIPGCIDITDNNEGYSSYIVRFVCAVDSFALVLLANKGNLKLDTLARKIYLAINPEWLTDFEDTETEIWESSFDLKTSWERLKETSKNNEFKLTFDDDNFIATHTLEIFSHNTLVEQSLKIELHQTASKRVILKNYLTFDKLKQLGMKVDAALELTTIVEDFIFKTIRYF